MKIQIHFLFMIKIHLIWKNKQKKLFVVLQLMKIIYLLVESMEIFLNIHYHMLVQNLNISQKIEQILLILIVIQLDYLLLILMEHFNYQIFLHKEENYQILIKKNVGKQYGQIMILYNLQLWKKVDYIQLEILLLMILFLVMLSFVRNLLFYFSFTDLTVKGALLDDIMLSPDG